MTAPVLPDAATDPATDPAGHPCPYCRCCPEQECRSGCMKDAAGQPASGGADMAARCPCWRAAPAAAQVYAGSAG